MGATGKEIIKERSAYPNSIYQLNAYFILFADKPKSAKYKAGGRKICENAQHNIKY